jgi:hypothetical protein
MCSIFWARQENLKENFFVLRKIKFFVSQNYSLAGLGLLVGRRGGKLFLGMRGLFFRACPTPDPPSFDATFDGFRTLNTVQLSQLIKTCDCIDTTTSYKRKLAFL